MSISKKIIEGNNQPSEGNAVVGGGGARALNPSEFIDPNHVLNVDASGQLITDINNSLDTRLFRGKGLVGLYPNSVAAYGLRSLRGVNGGQYVVRLRRASDNEEKDFSEADLTGSVEGAELITNGGFDTNTDWYIPGNRWDISSGQAVCDGTNTTTASMSQNYAFWNPDSPSDGDLFILSFDIVSCSDFTKSGMQLSNIHRFWSNYGITSPGSYKAIIRWVDSISPYIFAFVSYAGVSTTLDNVSLKPYTATAAEEWVIGSSPWLLSQDNTALVTTWYDQSGSGNDATQSTSTAQPKLITAGVTELENGKPTLVLDGSNDHLNIGSMGLLSAPWLFSVGKLRSPDATSQILFDTSNSERRPIKSGSTTIARCL